MRARKGRSEAGSAALLCLVAALAAALALGVARLAAASAAAARAETAADAAALAAARELATGRSEADATRLARVAATANGARLLRCDCRGPEATVTVAVRTAPAGLFFGPAEASARASLHPECPG